MDTLANFRLDPKHRVTLTGERARKVREGSARLSADLRAFEARERAQGKGR
jgi:hypothetical protein